MAPESETPRRPAPAPEAGSAVQRAWRRLALPGQYAVLAAGCALLLPAGVGWGLAQPSEAGWAAGGLLLGLGVGLLVLRRACGTLGALAATARALRTDALPVAGSEPGPQLFGPGGFERHRASRTQSDATRELDALLELARSRYAALSARAAQLGLQLEHRTHELSTLQDLSIGLAGTSDLHDLVDEALAALQQTIDVDAASMWARDGQRPGAGDVVLLGYRGPATPAPGGPEAGAGESLRGLRLSRQNLQAYERVEREDGVVVENRARQGFLSWLWNRVTDDARSSVLYRDTRAWMAAPMRVRGEVIGVLRVDHAQADRFEPEHARLLAAVGSQAGLAMRHASLLEREREVAIATERNRIARELHDAISQTLFAANLIAGNVVRQLESRAAPPDEAALGASLRTLERLNRGALAEMRLLMLELRPDALQGLRLPELLQQAVEAVAARGDVTVHADIEPADGLDAERRIQVYRIAQEALSNVVRHSGAREVTLAWRRIEGPGWRLHLRDDGHGFEVGASPAGHFGLDNMRSRAREVGATLTIDSTPAAGTCVQLDIPEVPE